MIENKLLKKYIRATLKEYKQTAKSSDAINKLFNFKIASIINEIKKITNEDYVNKLEKIVEKIIKSKNFAINDSNPNIIKGLNIETIKSAISELKSTKSVREADESISDFEHVKIEKISNYIKQIENSSYLKSSLWKALSFATGTTAVDLSTGWFNFASNEFLSEIISTINNTNVDTNVVNVISVFTLSCLYLVCRAYQKKHSVKSISKELTQYTAAEDKLKGDIDKELNTLENNIKKFSNLDITDDYTKWCSERKSLIKVLKNGQLKDNKIHNMIRRWSADEKAKKYTIMIGAELFVMHLPANINENKKHTILIKSTLKDEPSITKELEPLDALKLLDKIAKNYYSKLSGPSRDTDVHDLITKFKKQIQV